MATDSPLCDCDRARMSWLLPEDIQMTPENEQIYALADGLNSEQILTVAGTLALHVCAMTPDPMAALDDFAAALRRSMQQMIEQAPTAAQA
jgi:hypothetical protein